MILSTSKLENSALFYLLNEIIQREEFPLILCWYSIVLIRGNFFIEQINQLTVHIPLFIKKQFFTKQQYLSIFSYSAILDGKIDASKMPGYTGPGNSI